MSDPIHFVAALHNRHSISARYLTAPAPQAKEVDTMLRAAVTAPDHGAIRPWRFAVLEGEQRAQLGACFAASAKRQDPDITPEQNDIWIQKCTRAPTVIVVAAKVRTDIPKVPVAEELASTAVAAQHIQLAANALGYGSCWVTGPHSDTPEVKAWLQLADTDHIVAILHIGTSSIQPASPTRPDPEQFMLHPGAVLGNSH